MAKQWSKYQEAIFDTYENTKKNIMISATAGCLGIDTPVLMYDGSIKPVQDIQVGDQVMGPDSTPRTVLQLHRGKSNLYKINPTKGDSWICNEEHILTVWDEYVQQNVRRYPNTKHKTALVDYPLKKILNRKLTSEGKIACMFLQRAVINFPEQQLPLDPYFLGLWLADGTKQNKVQITVNADDQELFDYLEKFKYGKNDLIYHKVKRDNCNCYYVEYSTKEKGNNSNELLTILKTFINENKSLNIPKEYYINSRKNRLQLLAGLLDGDGWIDWKKHKGRIIAGSYGITTKYPELRDIIIFLCRSLGLAAYSTKRIGRIKSLNFEGEYWGISISGNLEMIPTKLPRKKATKRMKPKSVLRTGFSIKLLGLGDWYGFSVDKDERFVLGDFTITHNSGKSTVLVELCKRTCPSKRLLFMAFNKAIADELKKKLPHSNECCTFHSKGFKILLSNFKFKPKLNENKTFQICKKILRFDEIDYKEQNKYIFDLQTIWNQIRVNLFTDYENEIPWICMEKEIDFKERMIEDIEKIQEEWSKQTKKINMNEEFSLDFTDMLWLPYTLIDELNYPKYDVVMVDETQDLNTLQREMVLRFVKPKGRTIMVGDRFQAIYSFQGASVENFDLLSRLPNTITLPLSVTYRCAKRIVEEAQTVFPNDIESYQDAEEGIVRFGKLSEAKENDFVLCRNNLPLIEAFLKFLEEKKKSTIKGKDLGDALCRLLDKIDCIEDLDELLDEKLDELMQKGMSRQMATNNQSYISLEEKCKILRLLYKRFLGTIDQLKEQVNSIFVEENQGITLCTCHRSKGLEADRVFFLNPELIPSDHAKTERAIYAEMCLKFVAITRARKELIYCNI